MMAAVAAHRNRVSRFPGVASQVSGVDQNRIDDQRIASIIRGHVKAIAALIGQQPEFPLPADPLAADFLVDYRFLAEPASRRRAR